MSSYLQEEIAQEARGGGDADFVCFMENTKQ